MGILRDVLNDVAACGLSASMKGCLCHWAIEMAFLYAGGAVEATVLTCYEETLEAARQASGQAFSTSKLQAELRARGRADLAKRVCKQAKARQGTAHPDVGLAKDVTEALSTSEEASSTLPGSGGGSSEGDGASRPESVQVSQTDRHDGEANPPCIPQSHAGRPAHADSGDVRARIVSIYTQHNPAMLASGEVDKLLARFHGQEDVLYMKVLSKYIHNKLQTMTGPHADSMGNEVAQPPAATSRLADAPHAVSNGDAVVCSGLTETMMAAQPKQPGKMQEDTYNGPEAIQEESRTVPADYDDEALGSDVAPDEGTASLRKLCRDRILDLYSVHNPSKLQEVPDMIAKFKDQEHTLYLKVCSKYKTQPEPMLMSVPGLMNGRAPDDQQPTAHTSTRRPDEACSPCLRQAADQQRQLGLRKPQQRRRQLPA